MEYFIQIELFFISEKGRLSVGFMTRTFNNATVAATAGANLAYRDAYPHAYFTNILPLF